MFGAMAAALATIGVTQALAASARLETGDPLHVVQLRKGQSVSVQLGDLASPTAVRVQVLNHDGKVEHGGTVHVTPNADGRAAMVLPGEYPTLGVKYVDVWVGEGAQKPLEMSFAYMREPGKPAVGDGFVLGLQGERTDEFVMAGARAGAAMYRTGIDLRSIRPTEASDWNFAQPDRRIAQIRQLGMEPQVLVAYGIPWALLGKYRHLGLDAQGQPLQNVGWGNAFIHPVRDDVWEELLRRAARRYKGQVKVYEIWNEPDIKPFWKGTNQEYGRLLEIAHKAIKSEDPNAIVGTGGFAYAVEPGMGSWGGNEGLQEYVLREHQKHFDWHIVHLHGDFGAFRFRVDQRLLPVRMSAGVTQPLYFNETGYSKISRPGQREVAQTLYKKVLFAWNRGAAAYLWFTTYMGPENGEGEYGYGMFSGQVGHTYPRAVYPAYAALAGHVRGKKMVREMNLGPASMGYVLHGPEEMLAFFWQEDTKLPQTPLVVQVGEGSSAELLDVMGNATPVKVTGGCVEILPWADVAGLRVRGPQRRIEAETAVVRFTGAIEADDTQESTAEVLVSNPLNRPVKVEMGLAVPAEAAAVRDVVEVASGATVRRELRVPKVDGGRGAVSASLQYQVPGTTWQGTLELPVRIARNLVNKPAEERVADFALRDAKQVHDFFVGVPDKVTLLWSGENDLSAEVWLWMEGSNLCLQAKVRDQKHVQPNRGGEIWRGDSVQWALAVPGQNGYWELGVARGDDGVVQTAVWSKPAGMGEPPMQASVEPEEGGMMYRVSVPMAALGLTRDLAAKGVVFNLAVADADSADGRKAAMELAPGIVMKKDPDGFVKVKLR